LLAEQYYMAFEVCGSHSSATDNVQVL